MPYTYDFPRPALTVDILVFRWEQQRPELLLIQRKNPPFQHAWAFPGGFVDQDEDLLQAAQRELKEETGLKINKLYQAMAAGTPGRDPRGHTVSVVFQALLKNTEQKVKAQDDAQKAAWFPLNDLPEQAFDHQQIVQQVMEQNQHSAYHNPFLDFWSA